MTSVLSSQATLLGSYPEAERQVSDAIDALVSSAEEAASGRFVGAALGGALAFGEGAVRPGASGEARLASPIELFVIVSVAPKDLPAFARSALAALAVTAKSRLLLARPFVLSEPALGLLAPTLRHHELVAADRVLAGGASLLSPAKRILRETLPKAEGLKLLVKRGAALLAAERALDKDPGPSSAAAAASAVRDVDLALGAALLVSAGAWVAGEEGREAALRRLAKQAAPGGFQGRLSWTRFHDLVERHAMAFRAAAACEPPPAPGEARRQTALAADRFMEVLRLFEEERLGEPLPSWTAYVKALARRRPRGSAPLFPLLDPAALDELPSRRVVRAWPAAERLAPALAALLDWNPGDLPVAPVLLDLPDDAPRDTLRARAVAWAAEEGTG